MADLKSAEIFAHVFKTLAEQNTQECVESANEIYKICKDYNFTANQLYADEALRKLGLAKEIKTPDGRLELTYKGWTNWKD